MNWQPIETAPRDTEIMLTGPSNSVKHQRFVINGYCPSDSREWCDADRVPLIENGWRPTYWASMPQLP